MPAKETEVLAAVASCAVRRRSSCRTPARADPGSWHACRRPGATLTFADPQGFAPRRAAADLCAHFKAELAAFARRRSHGGPRRRGGRASATCSATQGDALGHLTRLQRLTAADAWCWTRPAVVTPELLESSGGSVRDSLFGVLQTRRSRRWAPGSCASGSCGRSSIRSRSPRGRPPSARSVEAPAGGTRLRALLSAASATSSASRAAPRSARPTRATHVGRARVPGAARRDPPRRAGFGRLAVGDALAELAPLDDLREICLAGGPRGRAAARAPRRRPDPRELARRARGDRSATPGRARAWIAGLEERERARTGISSLRVRFNRVFGYGIEVTHAQAARSPPICVRRQTLTGAGGGYATPGSRSTRPKAARRRRAAAPARVRAVRGGAPDRGGLRGGAP